MSVSDTEYETPFEVAVTGIVYVPAGVTPEPEDGGLVPLPFELAQLVIPQAKMASSVTRSTALRRLTRKSTPHASGSATGHPAGLRERAAVVCPVAISTTSLPVVLAEILRVPGLKVHVLYAGSVPHWNVKTPLEPPSGVISSV